MWRHWKLAGGVALPLWTVAASLWRGIRPALEGLGDIALVIEHVPVVAAILSFLAEPPRWVMLPAVAAGAVLIWRDLRGRRVPAQSSVLPAPTVDAKKSPVLAEHEGEPAPSFGSENLYVAKVEVDFSQITTELFIEITFVCFNATPFWLLMEEVAGCLVYEGDLSSGTKIELPTPAFVAATSERSAPAYSEYLVVLHQRIPSHLATMIETERVARSRVIFTLDKLNIMAVGIDRRDFRARLALWNGFTCVRADQNFVGRVTSVSVSGSVNARATP